MSLISLKAGYFIFIMTASVFGSILDQLERFKRQHDGNQCGYGKIGRNSVDFMKVGSLYGKKNIRNDTGRFMAVIPHFFD